MQRQQHRVDRQGGPQFGEDLVPEILVDLADRDPARLGADAQALDDCVPVRLAQFAPGIEWQEGSFSGRRVASPRAMPISSKLSQPVGMGANVFVSVSIPAMKIRIRSPPPRLSKPGRYDQQPRRS